MSQTDPLPDHSIANRTCQGCGMLLDDAAEFHPYVFCVLKKAGRDPWADARDVIEMLLGDKLPERPPLVRNTPLDPAGRLRS